MSQDVRSNFARVSAIALFALAWTTVRDAAGCNGPSPTPWSRSLVPGLPDEVTRIRGLVLAADARPAASVRVAVETGLADFETTTDAAGRFDVARPTASPAARCIVVGTGHAVELGKWVRVEAGRTMDAGVIRLQPSARIEGTVADEAGEPIPWSWVEIEGPAGFGRDWEFVARNGFATHWTAVERRGVLLLVDCDPFTARFVVDGLPPGTYRFIGHSVTHDVGVAVAVAPAVDVRITGTPFPDGPRLDVEATMIPPEILEPTDEILAETSAGIVRPERVFLEGSSEILRFATTPPCTLFVSGRAPGADRVEFAITSVPHAPFRIALNVRPRSRRPEVSTAVRRDREIAVRVPDAVRGAPDFRIDGSAAQQGTKVPCSSTQEGIVIHGFAVGEFEAAVRVRANGVWSRRVVVTEITAAPLDVTYPEGRTIRGRVLCAGVLLPGARVEILAQRPGDVRDGDVVVTDVEGRFALAGCDPAVTWSVSVTHAWGRGGTTLSPGSDAADVELVPWPKR